MKGIWGKNLSEEMNLTLAFVLDLGEQKKGRMNVAGASCFRVYADGKLIGFGPQRAAHGYARTAEYPFFIRSVLNIIQKMCFFKCISK